MGESVSPSIQFVHYGLERYAASHFKKNCAADLAAQPKPYTYTAKEED